MALNPTLLNQLAQGPGFVDQAFEGFKQGAAESDFQRSNAAREAAGRALNGDKGGLADLASLDPDQAMAIKQFEQQNRVNSINRFGAALSRKDLTPEQHSAVIRDMKSSGVTFEPGEELYANRGALASSTLTAAQRANAEFRQSQAVQSQSNFNRTFNLAKQKALNPKPTALQGKLKMLVESGVPLNTAKGIVTGRISVSINPNTGERVLVDKGTNKIIPLEQPDAGDLQTGPQAVAQTEAGNPTLNQAATDAAGVFNNLEAVLSQSPLGFGEWFMNINPGSKKALQAKQVFKATQKALITAFSANPRFPIAEQKRVIELLPVPGMFSNPESVRIKLDVLSKELKRIIAKDRAIAKSRAPISTRRESAASARSMQRFIDVIGADRKIPIMKTPEEARKLPPGTQFKSPDGRLWTR